MYSVFYYCNLSDEKCSSDPVAILFELKFEVYRFEKIINCKKTIIISKVYGIIKFSFLCPLSYCLVPILTVESGHTYYGNTLSSKLNERIINFVEKAAPD